MLYILIAGSGFIQVGPCKYPVGSLGYVEKARSVFEIFNVYTGGIIATGQPGNFSNSSGVPYASSGALITDLNTILFG